MIARRAALAALAAAVAVGGCGDAEGDAARFCTLATDSTRYAAVFDDFDPTDVETALETLRDARDAQRQIRAVAPGAVRADLDLVIGYVEELIDGLADASGDERPAVYQELLPRVGEVTAAGSRLDLYVNEVCVKGSSTTAVVISSTSTPTGG